MSRRLAEAGWVLAFAAAGSSGLAAQGDCRFEIRNVDRIGSQVVAGADTNYFAGGNVHLGCVGLRVSMHSDSVASYSGPRLIQFIGRVRYEDSTIAMTADRGTYYRDGERWEARGNVVLRNLETGSTLRGPALDYHRPIKGRRDSLEIVAIGRPLIEYVPERKAGEAAPEPYHINADRVRMRGNTLMWGGGRVTIDRSDFAARSDSLRLDTGPAENGSLIGGRPELRGLGPDSFRLAGTRIDLKLRDKELEHVWARGEGHAVNADWDLVADTIALDITEQNLEHTEAWGRDTRPYAVSASYAIRADSLALDTPGQVLTEARAFGSSWVGAAPDSLTGERNWLAGDSVIARFAQHDSAGTERTVLRQVEARREARSYYQIANDRTPARPSINYVRGDVIVLYMKEGARDGVERVDVRGQVDGIQLEPTVTPPVSDSSAAPTGRRRPGAVR